MSNEDTSSPTVMTESVLLTSAIEAKEKRHVVIVDIPNAFIQTSIEDTNKDSDRYIMKIRGAMVQMLCWMDPTTYKDYVVKEGKQEVLYIQVKKAIYGMLISALSFYLKLRKDLEDIGFVINPCDECVANKMIDGKQFTVCFHVDDLKASHADSRVVEDFVRWVEEKYGTQAELICTASFEF